MNVSEFLQEESRQVPARVEVEHFYAEIDRLRDAAERVAARIDRRLSAANEA
jgi:ubiquinone biosynthesis protein UbiJ